MLKIYLLTYRKYNDSIQLKLRLISKTHYHTQLQVHNNNNNYYYYYTICMSPVTGISS